VETCGEAVNLKAKGGSRGRANELVIELHFWD